MNLLVFTTLFAMLAQTPAPAPAPCLHSENETTEHQMRRRLALGLVRTVNTEQLTQRIQTGRYLTAAELTGRLPHPGPGWELQLVVAGDGYAVKVADATDPCGFAYFSDSHGVIYQAQPIR